MPKARATPTREVRVRFREDHLDRYDRYGDMWGCTSRAEIVRHMCAELDRQYRERAAHDDDDYYACNDDDFGDENEETPADGDSGNL